MQFFQDLLQELQQATPLEIIAVITGIISVFFSREEDVLVYPVGLINTVIYVYISFKFHLPGEAAVNFYYTVMSLYGWWRWSRRNDRKEIVLHISFENGKERLFHFLFFALIWVAAFIAITFLRDAFFEGAIPLPDSLAAASAFTGMYLMTKKKVESWYWWILTNIISIPLYYVKGLALTSFYYFILLLLAISGLIEWKRRANKIEKMV